MISTTNEARRKGIKIAAKLVIVTGLVAASTGVGRAQPARSTASTDGAQSESTNDESGTVGLVDALRVRQSSNCGCSPCWGPPAPPSMRAALKSGLAHLEAA